MSTDPLFMRDQAGQYFWYHNDHLGTPQMMTTSSGAVVWKTKYTAFGKAAVDPISTVDNPLRLPGQYEDAETGLHYNYRRFYDPEKGRYVKIDPIGLSGGINLFLYTSGNPINDFDPKGENPAIVIPVVTVVVVGVIVTAVVLEHMRRHPPRTFPIPDYPGEKHKYKKHKNPPKIKDVPDPSPPPDDRTPCDRLRDYINSPGFCQLPYDVKALTLAMYAIGCGPYDPSQPSN